MVVTAQLKRKNPTSANDWGIRLRRFNLLRCVSSSCTIQLPSWLLASPYSLGRPGLLLPLTWWFCLYFPSFFVAVGVIFSRAKFEVWSHSASLLGCTSHGFKIVEVHCCFCHLQGTVNPSLAAPLDSTHARVFTDGLLPCPAAPLGIGRIATFLRTRACASVLAG